MRRAFCESQLLIYHRDYEMELEAHSMKLNRAQWVRIFSEPPIMYGV